MNILHRFLPMLIIQLKFGSGVNGMLLFFTAGDHEHDLLPKWPLFTTLQAFNQIIF